MLQFSALLNMKNKVRHIIFSVCTFLFGWIQLLHAQTNIPTVKIGNQEWMTQNLDVSKFRNGEAIPQAKTNEEWMVAYQEGLAAWCYYDNIPEKEFKYGKLYNWFAVNDPRGLAPKGFHVPSKAEWDTLVAFLGGDKVAGKKLKSSEGWPEDGNGTNESGFTGLPGSMRYYNGIFNKYRKYGHWWTVTELPPFYAWQYYLLFSDDGIGYFSSDFGKGAGMSVRCLRD